MFLSSQPVTHHPLAGFRFKADFAQSGMPVTASLLITSYQGTERFLSRINLRRVW
jgi:hypothetical protein